MSQGDHNPHTWRTDNTPEVVFRETIQDLTISVVRFRDPQHRSEPLPPSFALVAPLTGVGAASPESAREIPQFLDRDGLRVIRLRTEPGTSLYGTGEIAGPLLRNGRETVAWNADTFLYTDESRGLYQSHPWVLAVREDGSAFGVLADTTYRCWIDLRKEIGGIEFRCEGHSSAIYLIEATPARGASPPPDASRDAHPADGEMRIPAREALCHAQTSVGGVLRGLAAITGRMPMPPKWALGYHQCRWSYEPEARVRHVAAEFRRRRLPCDCIWLDIDYMDGFRCFTFDPNRFPDPKQLNDDLHADGFKTVWMIDPGIKVEPDYFVYKSGHEGNHFLLTPDGKEYHGQVWPGTCAFPDFTRAQTRRWWGDFYKDFLANGIDGVWNDMNEPAVFDNPLKQVPENLHHRADEDLGGPGPHARYHNVYGMLMVRASREGMERARPDKRPFILTRSNYIGGHRYAATWTGDNESTWPHLAWSITMILNLGLSAQPFSGPDIGGFFGHCSPELFARWMGVGTLLPFARAHSIKDSPDHEPWAFGPEAERVSRLALQRRYRLIPYLYTLFREASVTGLPIARPLFFADPTDSMLRAAEDSFLLGESLLVRADVTPTDEGDARGCRSPVPRGIWRTFEVLDPLNGQSDPQLPELRLAGGAILPLGPVMQYVDEMPLDPLTLVVSLDDSGQARGELYEDAGDGYGYRDGEYLITRYRARRIGEEVIVDVASSEGSMQRPRRQLDVIVLLSGGRRCSASGRDGEPVRVPLPPRSGDRRRAGGGPPTRNGDAGRLNMLMPGDVSRIVAGTTRSISAENPTGAKSGGAQAEPGNDPHTSAAARELGRGWKVRPCLKDLMPGQSHVLADVEGPGVIQHIWCTVLHGVQRWLALRVFYEGMEEPSIEVPLGDFFANGVDGSALVNSAMIAVNPKGGMNSYWPMPFRRRIRIEITNDGPEKINEFFYQVSYAQQSVADDAGYLHACWRRGLTTRKHPEHVILDGAADGAQGRGHYVGTYLVWNQLSNGWWGEGEIKMFIDGDPADAPTICGTGTEDYFGGAWGFVMDHASDMRPTTYSTLYLGYPQAVYGATAPRGPIVPVHGLYRWHVPDPIRFERELRVTMQALGWWPGGVYQPLTDDIASTALWYLDRPAGVRRLAEIRERYPR